MHAFAALAAFALGAVQLAAPKGTIPHRLFGWLWAGLMLAVVDQLVFHPRDPAMGSVEPDPPVVGLHAGDAAAWRFWHARRHDVRRHQRAMTALFAGALVVAGVFTFLPGRIMHAVVFGP